MSLALSLLALLAPGSGGQPGGYWPSPPMIQCGPGFFAPATRAALERDYGSFACFRFQGTRRWIVAADGMSPAGTRGARSGAMVAVELCATTACLNRATRHAFARFEVARAPDSTTWPVKFEMTSGARLLLLFDGRCGPINFDVVDLRWHSGKIVAINALLSGHRIEPLPAVPPESGAAALGHPVRAAPMLGCCTRQHLLNCR